MRRALSQRGFFGADPFAEFALGLHYDAAEGFAASRTYTAAEAFRWKFGLDKMMGLNLREHDRVSLGEGVLAGSASAFRFGPQDRKDVLEYLQKNFGLDKKPRAVKTSVGKPRPATRPQSCAGATPPRL